MSAEEDKLAKIRKQFEDIGPRCDVCDLPWGRGLGQCPRKDDLEAYNVTVVGTDGWGSSLTHLAYRQWSDSTDACRDRRVDWRKRALAAERRLPTSTLERGAVEWLKREALQALENPHCGSTEKQLIPTVIIPLLDRLLGE